MNEKFEKELKQYRQGYYRNQHEILSMVLVYEKYLLSLDSHENSSEKIDTLSLIMLLILYDCLFLFLFFPHVILFVDFISIVTSLL